MTLLALGLSHFSAPVSVRERLSVAPGRLAADTLGLRDACGLSEAVLLSTCSRFEVYLAADDGPAALARVRAWLAERAGAALDPYLYVHEGPAAARHLTRVAAGLDSWIVGETEILGQVKAAYQGAQSARTAGRVLNILFQKGIGAGKAVRAETGIAVGLRSVGGAAALLAKKVFGDGPRRVLVFGAGQMARVAVRHLAAKGVKSVTVANRTFEKAAELAAELGGTAARFEDALEGLHEADVAIFSTSAEGFVAGRALVASAAARRGGRSLFIIDVGVPRNVEPAAAEVPGVYLYDIDDLKRMVERDQDGRREAASRADAMAEELAADAWSRIARPTATGVAP